MLEVNPMLRKKPEDYLSLSMFDPYKKKFPELLLPPDRQIKLEIDAKHSFDYEKSIFKTLNMNQLKQGLREEIDKIK